MKQHIQFKADTFDTNSPPAQTFSLRPVPGEPDQMILAAHAACGDLFPYRVGSVRQVVLEAERLQAHYPAITIDASRLTPAPVQARGYRERLVAGEWATVVIAPFEATQADHAYQRLRAMGFRPEGDELFVEHAKFDVRVRLVPRANDLDAEAITAWEVIFYRLAHDGEMPAEIEVPDDTCPRCLSRFVAVPMDGSGYHCLECHYHGT